MTYFGSPSDPLNNLEIPQLDHRISCICLKSKAISQQARSKNSETAVEISQQGWHAPSTRPPTRPTARPPRHLNARPPARPSTRPPARPQARPIPHPNTRPPRRSTARPPKRPLQQRLARNRPPGGTRRGHQNSRLRAKRFLEKAAQVLEQHYCLVIHGSQLRQTHVHAARGTVRKRMQHHGIPLKRTPAFLGPETNA